RQGGGPRVLAGPAPVVDRPPPPPPPRPLAPRRYRRKAMPLSKSTTRSLPVPRRGAVSPLGRLARNGVLAKFRDLRHGLLEVVEGDCRHRFGEISADFPNPVRVEIRNPAFYPDLAFGGSIGAAEAYMLGHWRCDNLVDLVDRLVP